MYCAQARSVWKTPSEASKIVMSSIKKKQSMVLVTLKRWIYYVNR